MGFTTWTRHIWVGTRSRGRARTEHRLRLEKERGEEVLAIIPLDLDGYLFSDECELEYAPTLRKRHAARFAGWEDDDLVFDAQLARVVKSMRAGEVARISPPEPRL